MLRRVRAGNRTLFMFIAALTLGTLFLVAMPEIPMAVISLPFDVVVNDTALLVGIAVIWLALLRFHESRDPADAAIAGAFLVSVALNLVVITLQASGSDAAVGMALGSPDQEPLYLHSMARVLMAASLFAGGLIAVGRWRPRSSLWILAPVAASVVLGVVIHLSWQHLPVWLPPESLLMLTSGSASGSLPGVTVFAWFVQAAAAMILVGAAALYSRWRSNSPSPFASYLAMALIIGAASEIHFALYPGSFSGVVGTNDLLRLAFAGVLLIGIAADRRASSNALSAAEQEIAKLREAELARAVLLERARLAREIHDGLSQRLWLAKLRVEQLASAVSPHVRDRMAEVADLIDNSLLDAQQTVFALHEGTNGLPLVEALTDYVAAFMRQRGIRTAVDVGEALADVPPKAGAELLRVVQEALANVARHADATVVTIRASRQGGLLELEVHDNGVGFQPDEVTSGFGLTSMRERVEGLGGSLFLESAPSAGTVVRAEVPIRA